MTSMIVILRTPKTLFTYTVLTIGTYYGQYVEMRSCTSEADYF